MGRVPIRENPLDRHPTIRGVVAYLAERLAKEGAPQLLAHGYAAALAALALLPEAAGLLGPGPRAVVANLRRESATVAEASRFARGYYEEMTDTRVTAGAWLAGLEGNPEPPDPVLYLEMSRPADDLLERELIPGWTGEV